MVDQQLHDTIERYLLHQLPPDERERLEAACAADAGLFGQIELQRLGLAGLQRFADAGLSEKMAHWDRELDSPRPAVRVLGLMPHHWAWAAAALSVLLTGGAFWHFGRTEKMLAASEAGARAAARLRDSLQNEVGRLRAQQTPSDSLLRSENRRLLAELDKKERQPAVGKPLAALRLAPAPQSVQVRGGGGDVADPLLSAAGAAFAAGQFAEAARLLRTVAPGDPRSAQALHLLPYALFYARDFRPAAAAFLDLWASDKYEAENAQFYLLLCHTATGETAAARAMLLTILADPGHRYYGEAERAGTLLR